MARTLRLLTMDGRRVEARVVNHGDRFGPAGRHVYQSYKPSVEITRVRTLPGDVYLNTFSCDVLTDLRAPYPPLPLTNDGALRLPPAEVSRLVEWVDDPSFGAAPLPVRTLVVADESRIPVVEEALAGADFDVASAHDAEAALRLAAARAPALVVAQAGLPEMDGNELTRQLRRSYATANAIVVILGASDERGAFDAGANATLHLPLDGQVLRRAVDDLLNLV